MPLMDTEPPALTEKPPDRTTFSPFTVSVPPLLTEEPLSDTCLSHRSINSPPFDMLNPEPLSMLSTALISTSAPDPIETDFNSLHPSSAHH